MSSPDIVPSNGIARAISRSTLILLLAACETPSSKQTPEQPQTFRFPSGTVFLAEANSEAATCGTLGGAKDGTRIQVKTYHDPYGTTQQTFGGYRASELGLCPNDPDGIIWRNEGLDIGQLPANH